MIVLLSPAKIQNISKQFIFTDYTQPEFLREAAYLVAQMQLLSSEKISKLLDVNYQLAQQNVDRYFNWQVPFNPQNAKQAILTFHGEVYHGLDAVSFSETDMQYAQSHVRILSGLYGILRPLDLMQPYRLEISSKLHTSKGKDLYAFWKEDVTKSLNETLLMSNEKRILLNLASTEYFKAINLKMIDVQVIDFEFLQYKEGRMHSAVMYTKKARGLMARYTIQNRIEDVEKLKGFALDNYWYNEELSSDRKMVFVR